MEKILQKNKKPRSQFLQKNFHFSSNFNVFIKEEVTKELISRDFEREIDTALGTS